MPNAIYGKIAGTPVTWTDSTGDLAMTLQNLATDAGRQGAQKDWLALTTARPVLYTYRFIVQFETAPVVGNLVNLRWKEGDGTYYDNDDGTGDIAVSAENKLKNTKLLDSIEVDEAAADVNMSVSGLFFSAARYGMPIVWNAAADNLQNTANVCKVIVTPYYNEVQDAP